MALETQWHKTDEELETAVRKDTGVVVRLYAHHVDVAHDPGTNSVLGYTGENCAIQQARPAVQGSIVAGCESSAWKRR